jgi:hypothetical protein
MSIRAPSGCGRYAMCLELCTFPAHQIFPNSASSCVVNQEISEYELHFIATELLTARTPVMMLYVPDSDPAGGGDRIYSNDPGISYVSPKARVEEPHSCGWVYLTGTCALYFRLRKYETA